jgi:hypothetical protein
LVVEFEASGLRCREFSPDRGMVLSTLRRHLKKHSPGEGGAKPIKIPFPRISRLSRREATLLVLSKKESSFAIARISFCVSNHTSSPFECREVGVRPQPKRKQSRSGDHKRTQLDRLYQKIVDDLDELLHAVGLKAA